MCASASGFSVPTAMTLAALEQATDNTASWLAGNGQHPVLLQDTVGDGPRPYP